MCIIVSKKKGLELPTKEILRNCFNYNSDGAEIMFNDGKQVFIEKGFMDFNSFYSRLMEIDKEVNLVNSDLALHFRISILETVVRPKRPVNICNTVVLYPPYLKLSQERPTRRLKHIYSL